MASNYPEGVHDSDPYFDLPDAHEDEEDEENEGPRRVPCSYPGCQRLTTVDAVYDDLCYEHVRADNE